MQRGKQKEEKRQEQKQAPHGRWSRGFRAQNKAPIFPAQQCAASLHARMLSDPFFQHPFVPQLPAGRQTSRTNDRSPPLKVLLYLSILTSPFPELPGLKAMLWTPPPPFLLRSSSCNRCNRCKRRSTHKHETRERGGRGEARVGEEKITAKQQSSRLHTMARIITRSTYIRPPREESKSSLPSPGGHFSQIGRTRGTDTADVWHSTKRDRNPRIFLPGPSAGGRQKNKRQEKASPPRGKGICHSFEVKVRMDIQEWRRLRWP